MQLICEPLVFEPVIKRARWGGRALESLLDKQLGNADDYAESWEITHQDQATSIVQCGTHQGQSLDQIMRTQGNELLGDSYNGGSFPLLIKFLDANDWLSLQVHPNDEQAGNYWPGGQGKTEAWVIIDAQADSQICAGLLPDVDQNALKHHLQSGTVAECLHFQTVQPGDCVFIPAGTVHALGPGLVLAEIQQQSDLTFRLHDWGRMGTDGKPRDLHVDQSLDCINFNQGSISPVMPLVVCGNDHQLEELVRCPYFEIRRHTTESDVTIETAGKFRVLMILEGEAIARWASSSLPLSKGTTVLVPASLDALSLQPLQRCTLLEVLVP